MTAGHATTTRPPKPTTQPFTGLPNYPAMRTLQEIPAWVAWDYFWKEDRQKWDKPPINAKTGKLGSSTDPTTWADYQRAAAITTRNKLAGVGFVISQDCPVSGVDLDGCRDPETGKFQAWAQVALDFRETYAEVSPSGRGLRFFVKGKIDGRKIDAAQVELYADGRYLTVTGQCVLGAPEEINEAPRLVAYLQERADQFREAQKAAADAARETERRRAEKEQERGSISERAAASVARSAAPATRSNEDGKEFWRNVNARALGNLAVWVPQVMPQAKRGTDGGYRVTSRNLSRNLEEDLSFHPSGIKDWGVHDMGDPHDGGRTPIQIVMDYLPATDAREAALWLCNRMSVTPESLGWRGGKRAGYETQTGAHPAGTQQAKPQQDRTSGAAPGILIPIERDKLQIVQTLGEAPAFPVEHLPTILRGAVEALEDHVQAPQALCAHSILSAAMLTAQGLADVEIRPLGSATPLSLFMLAVAVSGERKSACDNLALVAVSQHEADLRQEYEDNAKAYRASKAAYDAEKRIVERDGKLSADERRDKLMHLVEPDAPLIPIMKAKEPNLEGLLNLLNNGRASIGIFTSEGGQFLGGHGMGEEARTRTVTGLSELWDSGSAQRVRAKETTFLQGRRVGISLAAQPKVASSLLSDELAKDQGFVGRFLITMPDTTIGTRQIRETRAMDDDRLLAFHRQCRAVLAYPLPLRDNTRNEVSPPTLTLSRDAWAVWQGLAQAIEDECGPEGMWVPVRSAALKMAENVARIAGILTVFEDPRQATTRGVVSGATMASAASIGLFYLKEALRLTGHSILDSETRALGDLGTWLSEKIGAGNLISPSIIQRRAPAHLRTDAATTQKRVRRLVEFGTLELVGRAEIDGKTVREAYRIIGDEGGK